ncbi:hypothetical protein KY366_06340 [Candidatus Woesearchaeota archaeon]|nr:hypothetical protein [Candidatus Woesearchaeota archaeon]
MAENDMNSINPKDVNEFKKDFGEMVRVYSGIDHEYFKLGKDLDKYIREFKKALNIFNKKYPGIIIRLKQAAEGLQLRIFLKENSVKDALVSLDPGLNDVKEPAKAGFLRYYRKGMIEVLPDQPGDEKSPQFRLFSYYAVRDGIKGGDVYSKLSEFGFSDKPALGKVRAFLKRFDPRIGE